MSSASWSRTRGMSPRPKAANISCTTRSFSRSPMVDSRPVGHQHHKASRTPRLSIYRQLLVRATRHRPGSGPTTRGDGACPIDRRHGRRDRRVDRREETGLHEPGEEPIGTSFSCGRPGGATPLVLVAFEEGLQLADDLGALGVEVVSLRQVVADVEQLAGLVVSNVAALLLKFILAQDGFQGGECL